MTATDSAAVRGGRARLAVAAVLIGAATVTLLQPLPTSGAGSALSTLELARDVMSGGTMGQIPRPVGLILMSPVLVIAVTLAPAARRSALQVAASCVTAVCTLPPVIVLALLHSANSPALGGWAAYAATASSVVLLALDAVAVRG